GSASIENSQISMTPAGAIVFDTSAGVPLSVPNAIFSVAAPEVLTSGPNNSGSNGGTTGSSYTYVKTSMQNPTLRQIDAAIASNNYSKPGSWIGTPGGTPSIPPTLFPNYNPPTRARTGNLTFPSMRIPAQGNLQYYLIDAYTKFPTVQM